MTSFYDEIDGYMERDLQKIERELLSEYADAQIQLINRIKDIRADLGSEPIPYVKLLEEQRLVNIYNQIDSEITRLTGRTYDTVYQSLNIGAEYGFMGTTYALERELGATIGYSLLDKDRVSKLIAMDPSGIPLSTRLYQRMTYDMQSAVKSTVLMGLTQGLTNQTMARQLSDTMGTSYNHAKTIIRTESGRMRSLTQQDAFKKADDMGIDFEKVWVARLDKKTRQRHAELDGQAVPPDEDFLSADGYEAPQPRLFGIPSMDINCRCTTISHIKGTELGTRNRRSNEATPDPDGGQSKKIVNVKNYNDWLKKYHPEAWEERYGPIPQPVVKTKGDILKGNKKMYPPVLAGAKRGDPMSFEEADGMNANPNYNGPHGYRINCQTCVVSYESRLRGYNVQALPNTKGSVLERVSRQTNLPWIDPKTGLHPEYIKDDNATTPKKLYEFLTGTLKKDERYTIEFGWKGRGRSGHIISLGVDDDGLLKLYDPQCGKEYFKDDVMTYFGRMKYSVTSFGQKFPHVPKVLRVDNMEYDMDIVDKILEETK